MSDHQLQRCPVRLHFPCLVSTRDKTFRQATRQSPSYFQWTIKQKSLGNFLKANIDWVQEGYDFDEKSGSPKERTSASSHDRTITTPHERGSYMARMKHTEKCEECTTCTYHGWNQSKEWRIAKYTAKNCNTQESTKQDRSEDGVAATPRRLQPLTL